MHKVCAWCDLHMGTVPGQDGTEQEITHAICPECKTRHFAHLFAPAEQQAHRQAKTIVTLSKRLRDHSIEHRIEIDEKEKIGNATA